MAKTAGADARFLVAGTLFLAVAMGVGRFAYTPLLPIMERDAGLTVAAAGTLASVNLFGYLVGASLAMHPRTHPVRLPIARWSLAVVVATTALMAGPPEFWLPLRFLTGVASGFVLVFASSITLERAARAGRHTWPPLFFSGVGIGIAFTGIAVPWFAELAGSRGAWLGIAAACAAALAITARWFVDDAPPPARASVARSVPSAHRATFGWLLAVYLVEAFAYIIPATFLAAIVAQIPTLARFAPTVWIVVGLAGALATFPWITAGVRLGKTRALALALGLQATGIAALAWSSTALAVAFGAIALGGTFMAITLFAAGIGRDLFPHATSSSMSRLTVCYSVGQMAGPLAATQFALRFGSYHAALVAAAAAAALAMAATLVGVDAGAARRAGRPLSA